MMMLMMMMLLLLPLLLSFTALWGGELIGQRFVSTHCGGLRALKEAQLALRLCSVDAICIKLMSSSTDKQSDALDKNVN